MICKVTDFGFAKALEQDQKETLSLGTPFYMAPELAQRHPYDSKVDIWALGVLIHIILAGVAPFPGKDSKRIFRGILNDVPSLAELSKYHQQGKFVKDFIKKCLIIVWSCFFCSLCHFVSFKNVQQLTKTITNITIET